MLSTKHSEKHLKKISKKISKAKKDARSELDVCGWSKHNLASHVFASKDSYPRTAYSLSRSSFDYCIPHVISDALPERHFWTLEALGEYRNERVKVGQDDEGKSVYLSIKNYLKYVEDGARNDDSPLYIFDSHFAKRTKPDSAKKKSTIALKEKRPRDYSEKEESERTFNSKKRKRTRNGTEKKEGASTIHNYAKTEKKRKRKLGKPPSKALCHMVESYSVPKFFRDDLLRLTGERRPPYRWLVIGPPRAGTGVHIDPLGTSAWNAVMQGRKHWILFPPSTPKEIYKCRTDHEASTWFKEVYPKLTCHYIEFVQGPGEVVYVPGGWAHVVMNLDFCIAITHNFCIGANLESVYLASRSSRPKLARKLRNRLSAFQGHKERKYRKLGGELKVLDTVPYVDHSSTSDSSSSSESDDEVDIKCECHDKVMVQGRLLE